MFSMGVFSRFRVLIAAFGAIRVEATGSLDRARRKNIPGRRFSLCGTGTVPDAP
ncbi:hypothetical protein [Prescottella sp. R16]|uniref:hypothetical protein n=1 Tax=Prescottella sp. R16 TaxID=3064529 RepID=UPI00272E0FCE|nr:hypothetical protein [Prescottella sp. R16]